MKPRRIHFTNERESEVSRFGKAIYEHYKCYCGFSFASFGGEYIHSVWHFLALEKGNLEGWNDEFCPDCMANPDLAIDVLGQLT